MPELPEVETIAASLRRRIVGWKIDKIEVFLPKLLRKTDVAGLRKFKGKKIIGLRRRGKLLLIACENDLFLLFHLKMTGQFHWTIAGAARETHTHLRISFKGRRRELCYRDVRKFGFLRCLATPSPLDCEELRALGPEPLEMDGRRFPDLIGRRKGRLKSLLLNQSFLAGIGNIYADEILFESGLQPLTSASSLAGKDVRRLWNAIQKILMRAVAAGGSSIRDYKNADGLDGHFQFYHKVYGREGLPCSRCGSPIERLAIGGRSSFFCPRCQRKK